MFGRTVKVNGKEIFVFCCPDTPLSEVLQRASLQMAKEERETAERDPNTAAYRAAIRAISLSHTPGQT